MKVFLALAVAVVCWSSVAAADEPAAVQPADSRHGSAAVDSGWVRFVGARPSLGTVVQLAFSPAGRQLAIGTSTDEVCMMNTATGKESDRFKAECSEQLAFSRDGWVFGAVGRRAAYHLWAADTGDDLVQLVAKPGLLTWNSMTCTAFSPDTTEIAMGQRDGGVSLLATATGSLQRSFVAYSTGGVGELAWSPDGKIIATSGGLEQSIGRLRRLTDENHDSIQLWDATAGKLLKELTSSIISDPNSNDPFKRRRDFNPSDMSFSRIAFSPNNARVAAVHGGSTIVWDLASGKQFYQLPEGVGYFSADGGMLFYYAKSNSIEAVELDSGQVCWSCDIPASLGGLPLGQRGVLEPKRRRSPFPPMAERSLSRSESIA